jgi:flagellin-like hook-associated protein FlgL
MIGIDTASLGRISVDSRRSSNSLQNAVGRLLNSGNATESMRGMGDGGGLSMVSRVGAENRSKSNLAKSMQNAVSYIQMQEAGLKKLNKVYNRMSQLAIMASDPFLDDGARAKLNSEFQTLKQDTFSMRSETFQGNFLFDDMAASYFPEVDFGKGFTDKTTSDGEVNVQSFSGHSGWTSNKSKRYTLEKEVHFNSGKFVLEVNGGGSGERYILKQGTDTLFDTAGGNSTDYKWKTEGTAYDYDFDRFEIEFAPGSATTFKFVPQTPGNSARVEGADGEVGTADDPIDTWSSDTRYDNKDSYIDQLGLGTSPGSGTAETNEEATPWLAGDDRTDFLFSGVVGEIQTYPALGRTTKLTLEVEADTIFQINATYTPLDAPTNNLTLEGGGNGDVVLNAVGIGITLIETKIDSLENARQALAADSSGKTLFDKELESLAAQMATLGANLSELEITGERLNNQVYLSEAGISRLTSDVMATESTELAKQQIRLQSSQALMAQAFSLSENILSTLL